jgi:hypothetical protein
VTSAYTSWDLSLIGVDWTNVGWYIQEAIWLIEQERDLSQVHSYSRDVAMFANTQANLMNLTGIVRVMNITATDGTPQQDQLVMVRVPDGGRSMQLLVIAILAMMAFDRFGGRQLARQLNF